MDLLLNEMNQFHLTYWIPYLSFVKENHIPVLEISQNQNYFVIIKYILGQIYNKEAANRLYFVSMHDIFSGILLNESNLNVVIEKVIIRINKM